MAIIIQIITFSVIYSNLFHFFIFYYIIADDNIVVHIFNLDKKIDSDKPFFFFFFLNIVMPGVDIVIIELTGMIIF